MLTFYHIIIYCYRNYSSQKLIKTNHLAPNQIYSRFYDPIAFYKEEVLKLNQEHAGNYAAEKRRYFIMRRRI